MFCKIPCRIYFADSNPHLRPQLLTGIWSEIRKGMHQFLLENAFPEHEPFPVKSHSVT